MRFRVYKIIDANELKPVTIEDSEYLYKTMVGSPKLEDVEEQDQYAIMYLT